MWQAFWDVFEGEVDSKTLYNGATKFNFLNSRLTEETKDLLVGLIPNNANYPTAIELLKERYGKPRKIIAAHMRAMYHLSKPNDNKSSIRTFIDRLESHIRGLEALGKGTDTYGDLLVCIIIDKLSPNVRRNLARQHGSIDWSLDDLRKALKQEIEFLDDVPNYNTDMQLTNSRATNILVSTSRKQPK